MEERKAIYGYIPFERKSQLDKIIKNLKMEFGKDIHIEKNMDHVYYVKTLGESGYGSLINL